MRLIPVVARLDLADGGLLRLEHDLVHGALLGCVAAVDRIGTRDVGGVIAIFAARIHQQQIAIVEACVVGVIMQYAGIGAAADDRVVGNVRAVAVELMQQFSHHFVFHATRATEAHAAHVCTGRDRAGAAQQVDLGAALE